MKKLFVVILSVLLCGTIFTSFSPSLDGRAVVAPEGTMPKGVFAKTVGYLPGDSISVTSLSTKNTVDILVIGSIDSSEGIAILLSPEAAELLGLSKDANNVVKITKRSGQLDEAVAGTAVIGGEVEKSEADIEEEADSAPEVAEQNVDEAAVEEISGENTIPENSEETEIPAAEENSEPELVDTVKDDYVEPAPLEAEPEVISEEEFNDEVPLDDENVKDENPDEESVAAEPVEEIPEENAETEKIEDAENLGNAEKIEVTEAPEVVEDEPSDETLESEEILVPVEECPEENEPDEKFEAVESDDLSEPVEEIEATEESPVAEPEPENVAIPVDGEDIVSEAPFEEEAVEADDLSEIKEQKPEAVKEDSLEMESVPEESVAAEPFVEPEENSDDESYEPIVLVPAEANPPAAETTETAKNEVNAKPVENKTEAKPAVKSGKTKNVKKSLEKYKVASLKDLESGKYYIQIVVLADESNLKATVSKFEGQYPITLVPLASGKATQVMIGPLNMDEYGAVLNRFKKSGYKDAFLRKIK